MVIWLHAPVERALKAGIARHGFEARVLSDKDIAAIPEDLHDELAAWVRRAAKGEREGKKFDPKYCLVLDRPDCGIASIVAALQEAVNRRRSDRLRELLALPSREFAELAHPFGQASRELKELSQHSDRLAARLAEVERARQAALESSGLGEKALREYALRVPSLARAAREDYRVQAAALRHLANAIAEGGHEWEAEVLDAKVFAHSKFVERSAPTEAAFSVLDAMREHVTKLKIPDGISVRVGPVSLMKRGVYRDYDDDWHHDSPITVVPVDIEAGARRAQVVVLGEAVDESEYLRDEEEDIPF